MIKIYEFLADTTQVDTLTVATEYTHAFVFRILLMGMAGIFFFMLVFYLLIKILNKAFKSQENEDKGWLQIDDTDIPIQLPLSQARHPFNLEGD